jgi:predicted phage baseplate assembly protein
VDFLSDFGPLDRVFRVDDPGTGEITVNFGDGLSGLVPTFAHTVYAVYRTSEGSLGNVPAGAVTRIDSIPDLTSDELAVIAGSIEVTNNSSAFGGSDPESTESIRSSAPLAFRAANRAVTLEDYQSIALSVPSVGQASAYVSDPSSVVVAVSPYRTPGTAEVRPGYDLVDAEWTETDELLALKESVRARLDVASLAGVSYSVIGPTYVTVYLAVTVDVMDGVRQSDARVLIEQAILSRFDYSQVAFGAKIYSLDIVGLVTSLGNIANSAEVDRLNIVSDTDDAVGTIEAAEDELLVISAASLQVTVTGGVEDSL